jgi:pimeloyl-ACP methyl ester carboxylesterase
MAVGRHCTPIVAVAEIGKSIVFQSRSVQADGVRLRLESSTNTGPALLCLHGVLRAGRDFAPLWGQLVPRWQLHALDHRGHGGSEWTPGRYFIADYTADAVAIVRDHLEGDVVILGHSLGALVAIGVAAALPDRITGIVLEDPPSPAMLADVLSTTWHAIWAGMEAISRLGLRDTSVILQHLSEMRVPANGSPARLGDLRDATSLRLSARCLRDLDPQVLAPLLANRWPEGYDLVASCAAVRCPALILRGDPALGGMLRRDEALAMARQMADGVVIDMPGVGHLIHWTAAETMARLVLGFLESL